MAGDIDPLMMAILAMDSYSSETVGNTVGNATVIKEDSADPAAQAAGFYAVAYQLSDGSIVISYRGTDASSPSTLIADAQNGWGIGVGYPTGAQATLAVQFYQYVAQAYPDATISVTGHSLGGGLAGFVGSLYSLSGTLFESVNYASAASAAYNANYLATVETDPDAAIEGETLSALIHGDQTPWALNASGLSAYANPESDRPAFS